MPRIGKRNRTNAELAAIRQELEQLRRQLPMQKPAPRMTGGMWVYHYGCVAGKNEDAAAKFAAFRAEHPNAIGKSERPGDICIGPAMWLIERCDLENEIALKIAGNIMVGDGSLRWLPASSYREYGMTP